MLRGRLRRSNRAIRRQVAANLVIPTSLVAGPRRRGSVWAVAMMRNEADTARHAIEHMLAQDVDAVVVADNGSTDETGQILESLSATHPVHLVRDDLMAYEQSAKMTALSMLARRAGADWIVPFDADELWFAVGRSVAEELRSSNATVVRAAMHNVFPGADDDADEQDPFLRLGRIDSEPAAYHKVAFRSYPFMELEMGNNEVIRRGRRSDGLFIAHFPWRSVAQMAGKLRHGRVAMEATELHDLMGAHWRLGGTWNDDHITAVWDDLRAGRHVDDLGWSPQGSMLAASPGRWQTWQLSRSR